MSADNLKKEVKDILYIAYRAYVEIPRDMWNYLTWFGKCTIGIVLIPMMYILFTFILFLIFFFGFFLVLIVQSLQLFFKKEKFS